MITGIDPRVDYAFKRVFGSENNEPILIDLLNSILAPPADRRIVYVEIMNPFNDKEYSSDKLSILDIKARDQFGRLYNIEMQMANPLAFQERVLYYWAVVHGDQLKEGEDYTELQATISIVFIDRIVFDSVADFHLHFQLRDRQHPDQVFTEHQSIHFLELPKFLKSAEDLTDGCDRWCYFLKNAAGMDSDRLPQIMNVPIVRQAMEVLKAMNESERERVRYLDSQRAARDRLHEQNYTRKMMDIASREGNAKGNASGRIQLAQRMLRMNVSSNEELEAYSLAELQSLADELEQRLRLGN